MNNTAAPAPAPSAPINTDNVGMIYNGLTLAEIRAIRDARRA